MLSLMDEKITREFIFDPSLALYLPLWKRDGASIMSEDGNGHIAAVTGAVWGAAGRTFTAASSHKIVITDTAVLDITGPMTAMVWFNCAAHNGNTFSKWNGTGNQRSWEMRVGAGGVVSASVTPDGTLASRVVANTVAYTASAWNCAFFVYDGSNIFLDVNGIVGTNVAYSSGIFSSSADVEVGNLVTAGYFNGTIRAVALWARAKHFLEREHIRFALKGRIA